MQENVERLPRVAVVHGDTNGIGYELIFKTFSQPEMLELCTPIVYGSPKVAAYHRKALNMQANFSIIAKAEDAQEGRVNLLTTFDEEIKIEIGTPTPESAMAAQKALSRALDDYGRGLFDTLVVAPMGGNVTPPLEKLLAGLAVKDAQPFPIMMNETVRVALLTNNIALKDVPEMITTDNIAKKTKQLRQTLKRDFRIENPRIAVLALNYDNNGQEEKQAIVPAIEACRNEGTNVFGPYSAEDLFNSGDYSAFDVVLAMHHEQGLLPLLTLSQEDSIKTFAGLTAVCTTTVDDNAFEEAGRGTADEGAFRHAVYAAIDLSRNHSVYDAAHVNPLPKLYHEKKEDGEKARFNIPKKHEQKPAAQQ